jgi:hypothetical protein
VICGADLDGVASLVDKSLVQRTDDPTSEPRFFMLDTIREYARQRLRKSGELDALRCRHTKYFVACAERLYAQGFGHDQAETPRRLRAERSNLHTVLSCALETDELEPALWLVGVIGEWWEHLGWAEETRAWLHTALPRSPGPTRARAARCSERRCSTRPLASTVAPAAKLRKPWQLRRHPAIANGSRRRSLGSALFSPRSGARQRAELGARRPSRWRANSATEMSRAPSTTWLRSCSLKMTLPVPVSCGRSPSRDVAEPGAQLSLANVLLSLAWLEIHDLDYEQAVGYLDEALAIARDAAAPLLTAFERTGANGCERSLAFAMQKVVGSSPIIRSPESPANRGFSVA